MNQPLVLLFFAIVCEIAATTALKASDGLTRLVPSILMVLGYGATFFFFSLSIKHLPLGIAYAIWSGAGTVGAVVIGLLVWREVFDLPRLIGVSLILAGVLILNMYTHASAAG